MKIYKNFGFFLLSALILGVTGCGIKKQVGEDINTSRITVSSTNESAESKVNDDIYINIVDQYVNAINHNLFHNILAGESNSWDCIGKDVNINLLSNSRDYRQYEIYYALEDMNGNGVPELFIGGSGGNDPLLIYDMFTCNQNRVINPFTELGYEFGNRTQLYVYKNGILEVEWSNSGLNNGMDFYKISEEGDLELIECVSLNKAPNEAIKYYHDAEGNIEISQEEFDLILKHYRDVDKAELPWVKINGK